MSHLNEEFDKMNEIQKKLIDAIDNKIKLREKINTTKLQINESNITNINDNLLLQFQILSDNFKYQQKIKEMELQKIKNDQTQKQITLLTKILQKKLSNKSPKNKQQQITITNNDSDKENKKQENEDKKTDEINSDNIDNPFKQIIKKTNKKKNIKKIKNTNKILNDIFNQTTNNNNLNNNQNISKILSNIDDSDDEIDDETLKQVLRTYIYIFILVNKQI